MNLTYIQTENMNAVRVMNTFLKVRAKFFQHHNFLVLPFPKDKCVYLPKLDYSSLISSNKTYSDLPDVFTKEDLVDIVEQLRSYKIPKIISKYDLEKEFNKIQYKLENRIKIVFPSLWKEICDIQIIVSPFGTDGSFEYKKIGEKYRIFIWIRNSGCTIKQAVSHIVHCYISAYVDIKTNIHDSLTAQWQQREAIIDFLITNTFKDLNTDYISTTLPFNENHQRSRSLVDESDTYLRSLNLIIQNPYIRKHKGGYLIDNKSINSFSEKEAAFFELLLNRKNEFISKNTILETLYDGYAGSDWSVSKLVERVRKKILSAGVAFPLIKTSRNMGYKLVCR